MTRLPERSALTEQQSRENGGRRRLSIAEILYPPEGGQNEERQAAYRPQVKNARRLSVAELLYPNMNSENSFSAEPRPQNGRLYAQTGNIATDAGTERLQTRGMRNNNPGNLRPLGRGDQWQGQIGIDDAGFVIFDNRENGLRAMGINTMTKYVRDGSNTIRRLVRGHASAPEDPVDNYIRYVSDYAGIDPDAEIDLWDVEVLTLILQRMAAFENNPAILDDYTREQFETAAQTARDHHERRRNAGN